MKNYKELLTENRAWAEETFAKIDKKLSRAAVRSRDVVVHTGLTEETINSDEKFIKSGVKEAQHRPCQPYDWVAGFWGGLNVMMYEHTGNEDYLLTARRSAELVDTSFSKFDKLSHDVGFMWHILAGALYRLTGEENYRNSNLLASAVLSSRFILEGGFIRAWNNSSASHYGGRKVENWSIIDCMMNLPLLYWASECSGDDRYKRIAMAHADNAIRTHIRPDGSVAHIVEHDRKTGDAVVTYAGQGCADGSSWSRGQAWALYGFVLSYMATGEARYLDAAKRVANYFIANVCDDWLPRVDFRSPSTPVYYDTTAGCCAACGLIELAKMLPENEGGMYANGAINMLRAISDKFGNYDPESDFMIGGGTIRYPIPGEVSEWEAGIHRYIIYGDYYFTEAILKLLGSDFQPWLSDNRFEK